MNLEACAFDEEPDGPIDISCASVDRRQLIDWIRVGRNRLGVVALAIPEQARIMDGVKKRDIGAYPGSQYFGRQKHLFGSSAQTTYIHWHLFGCCVGLRRVVIVSRR